MHWCMNLHGQFLSMRSSTLLGYAIVLEDIMGQLQKLCLEREVLKDGDSVSDCAFIMY